MSCIFEIRVSMGRVGLEDTSAFAWTVAVNSPFGETFNGCWMEGTKPSNGDPAPKNISEFVSYAVMKSLVALPKMAEGIKTRHVFDPFA